MRVNQKYLSSAIVISITLILCNNVCECDVNFQQENDKLANNDAVSIDSGEIDNSLSKRAWNKNFAVWGKRDWENFHSWGKRDGGLDDLSYAQLSPDKRKWAKFASWGKRGDDLGSDLDLNDDVDEKRKLESVDDPLIVDNLWPSLTTWGHTFRDVNDDIDKRKWSNLAVWGKRSDDPTTADLEKKWAKFASWGKRADDIDDVDKRKWSQFVSWGKRDNADDVMDAEKRKWSTLAAWGKRSYDDDVYDVDKRKWAKFSSWGKRLRNPQAWLALKNGGKRRWTGLTTWGRR